MNQNELKYFRSDDLENYDVTCLQLSYLMRATYVKIRRHLWGRLVDRNARVAWTSTAVSGDAVGPVANVRNYIERKTIRTLLNEAVKDKPIHTACEVGCGYGRIIMVLKEFAETVVGFEREEQLLAIARKLLPDIEFICCDSLDKVSLLANRTFDFILTYTVLQHLSDDLCLRVLEEIKRMAPEGYILLVEKTEPINITKNVLCDDKFISRSRSIDVYKQWMQPYVLVKTEDRMMENTYYLKNQRPGTCMLFKSSALNK